jgi:hypothetical protein
MPRELVERVMVRCVGAAGEGSKFLGLMHRSMASFVDVTAQDVILLSPQPHSLRSSGDMYVLAASELCGF